MEEKNRDEQDERKGKWLFLLVFSFLSISCAVLAILCLNGVENAFVKRHFTAFAVGVAFLVGVLLGLSIWFTLSGKDALRKSAFSVYLFLLFVFLIWLPLQKTGFFKVVESPERLEEYLEKAGAWMPIFYLALQYLQVVVLPIPSVVSTVAGVALFGAFWTMLYSLIGILLGSFTAFFIGRKLGNRAVAWIVGEETLVKWQKKMKGKDNLFLSAMFLLPVFPDDVLCFVAGLSSMSLKFFSGVILLSRLLAISATCYSIAFIPFNTWWGLTIWGAFGAILLVAFVWIYKHMDEIQRWFKRIQEKMKKKKK